MNQQYQGVSPILIDADFILNLFKGTVSVI